MGHGPVKIDPAIERFSRMREDAYIGFRWTRRTTRTFALGFIVAPAIIYYLADTYTHKWDFRGKLKGQPLDIKEAAASS
ncbi:hypothetical protein CVT24_003255 [Panaeolus cyanescens]|uniref:NADH-ubiquinone oxidoreductase B15 subunit n=1 Tax=Panaeolus cyanescens TaxID=181874 RepID=A0A409W1W0_9AGAR|nr:hypothetical protein CVT24_003255 [Panaeolus cyanescens]